MITWAASDGRDEGGDRIVPAASTIKIFVASAFWRSGLDPEARRGAAAAWSVADRGCQGHGDPRRLRLLMLAFSDNAATNVLLERLGFDAVNDGGGPAGCERTEVRRLLMGDGPENLTCARDLARGSPRSTRNGSYRDLALAQDSELHFRLAGREAAREDG